MKTLLLAALAALTLSACASDPYSTRIRVAGEFDDVRDALRLAIEGRGLNINHENQIAGMLDRTGRDLGATRKVYSGGEQFEFCSAKLSRAMMEADPHAITLCPYIVSVYRITGEDGVYIAYRKPPKTGDAATDQALAEVEALLDGIIEDAR